MNTCPRCKQPLLRIQNWRGEAMELIARSHQRRAVVFSDDLDNHVVEMHDTYEPHGCLGRTSPRASS